MAGASDVLLRHVAPALGCMVAWAMFLAPLKAVLQVRKSRALGAFNPLPCVAMWANCAAWLVYAYLTRDPYVLASNEPGLLLAAFQTVTCYGFADDKARDAIMAATLAFSLLLSGAGAAVSFSGLGHASMVSAWGWVTVVILLMFYAAPLSSVAEVLRARSSAALNEPLALMAAANGGLWAAYGWAVADPFIWGPNVVGACFGVLQVAMCKAFPSKHGAKPATPTLGGGGGEEGLSMIPRGAEASDLAGSAGAGGGPGSAGGGGGVPRTWSGARLPRESA